MVALFFDELNTCSAYSSSSFLSSSSSRAFWRYEHDARFAKRILSCQIRRFTQSYSLSFLYAPLFQHNLHQTSTSTDHLNTDVTGSCPPQTLDVGRQFSSYYCTGLEMKCSRGLCLASTSGHEARSASSAEERNWGGISSY